MALRPGSCLLLRFTAWLHLLFLTGQLPRPGVSWIVDTIQPCRNVWISHLQHLDRVLAIFRL